MAELTEREMAAKLSAEKFARSGPDADETTDPIADTPMVVTLDQLRPYDLNPRVTRNPRYDEILASVRERGLDTSPAITACDCRAALSPVKPLASLDPVRGWRA